MQTHDYKVVRRGLTYDDITQAIIRVNDSQTLEMDELSHVVIRGTKTRVGYVGNDTFELYDPNNKELKPYHDELSVRFGSIR